MASLRKFLQDRPMLGWGFAAALLLVAAVMVYMRLGSESETEQLTEMVTIRCSETGQEWQVLRGVMEKELYLRSYPVDPTQGLVNPATGKPTGFPVDDWKQTVERINAERASVSRPTAAPAAPTATGG